MDYVSRLVADVVRVGTRSDSASLDREPQKLAAPAILLAGFDQPLVLVTISTVFGGFIMFIYSILLVVTNRRYLPTSRSSAATGWGSSASRSPCSGSAPASSGSTSSASCSERAASIATVCLSGTLEDKLAAAAAAGFDEVELFEPDLVAAPLEPAEVRRRRRRAGLEIAMYQPLRDFEAMPEGASRRTCGGRSASSR